MMESSVQKLDSFIKDVVNTRLLNDLDGKKIKEQDLIDQMTDRAREVARRDRFAQAGQFIVVIAGMPFGTPGTTNLMRIATV